MKFTVPVVVGVPEISPVAVLSESPAGNAPTEIDHVKGAVPPAETRVCEYGTPWVALGRVVVEI